MGASSIILLLLYGLHGLHLLLSLVANNSTRASSFDSAPAAMDMCVPVLLLSTAYGSMSWLVGIQGLFLTTKIMPPIIS